MTQKVSRNDHPLKLNVIDQKKAHMCSEVLRTWYIEDPLVATRTEPETLQQHGKVRFESVNTTEKC